MTIPNNPNQVHAAYEEMDEVLKNITVNVSKFYIYKYLVDQAGLERLAFDKMQLTNTLSDALYNYALYATTREATNANREMVWGNINLKDVLNPNPSRVRSLSRLGYLESVESGTEKLRELEEKFVAAVQENVSGSTDDTIIALAQGGGSMKLETGSRPQVPTGMKTLHEKYEVHKHRQEYHNALEWLFDADWEEVANQYNVEGKSGWLVAYGGQAWGSVVRTMDRYDEFSNDAYIDLMLSVEHNNGNFLDKWDKIGKKEAEDELRSALPRGVDEAIDMNRKTFVEGLLQEVLQLARETNLHPLLDIAQESDPKLRRMRHLLPDRNKRIKMRLTPKPPRLEVVDDSPR